MKKKIDLVFITATLIEAVVKLSTSSNKSANELVKITALMVDDLPTIGEFSKYEPMSKSEMLENIRPIKKLELPYIISFFVDMVCKLAINNHECPTKYLTIVSGLFASALMEFDFNNYEPLSNFDIIERVIVIIFELY